MSDLDSKVKKIIKTNRCWDLRLHKEVIEDCIDVREFHDNEASTNYIAIPVEAVDELVLELLKFKRRHTRSENFRKGDE